MRCVCRSLTRNPMPPIAPGSHPARTACYPCAGGTAYLTMNRASRSHGTRGASAAAAAAATAAASAASDVSGATAAASAEAGGPSSAPALAPASASPTPASAPASAPVSAPASAPARACSTRSAAVAARGGERQASCQRETGGSGRRASSVHLHHGAGAGGILKERSLGMHYIALERLINTSHARQISQKSVKLLQQSIQSQDFMENQPLSVIFKGVHQAPFTQEDADKAGPASVLDGNHRLVALKAVKPGDFLVPCQCYSDIKDANVKRIVADACNDATSTFAERTIYDRLYFFSSLYRGAQASLEASRSRSRQVNPKDIKELYAKAKQTVPSDSTLRSWLKAVRGIKEEALNALKDLVESEDKSVDLNLVTLAYISKDDFMALSAEEQGFNLQILARWKKFQQGRAFKADVDTPPIIAQAKDVAQWYFALCGIVPYQDWSQELKSEFENMAYAKPALWSFQKAFLDGLEDEVSKLSKGLPQHGSTGVPKLEEWIVQALHSQQPTRIKKILESDASLRPSYEAFAERLKEAKNAVTRKKLQLAKPLKRPSERKRKGKSWGGAGRGRRGAKGRRGTGRKGQTQGEEEEEDDDEE
ncbi:unnamed protein product, partial [Ectocarpus sp. 12 AP-2014]